MSSVGRVSQTDIMRVLIDRSLEDGDLDPEAAMLLLSSALKENPLKHNEFWTKVLSHVVFDYVSETYRGSHGNIDDLKRIATIDIRVRTVRDVTMGSGVETPMFFYGCVWEANQFYLRMGREGVQGSIPLGPMFVETAEGTRFRTTEAFELFLDHLQALGFFQTQNLWVERPLPSTWPTGLRLAFSGVDPETGWLVWASHILERR